jgi:lysophospholipase L1-like esterase
MTSPQQKNIIASLIGIVIALLLAEAGLRLAGIEYTVYPTRFQFGWPDSKTLDTDFVLDPVIQWKPREYDDMLLAARNTKIDIVHMGDSCTQLGTYRADFMTLMHEHHPEKPFHSLKLAVAGWSSFQGLQQMRRDVLPLKPRYATIYFGWNDHWLSYGIPDKAMNFSKADFAVWRGLQHARLFQIGAYLYNNFFIQRGDSKQRPARVSPEDYRANLLEMIQLARAEGITPILFTAPSSHRVGEEPAYLQDRFLTDLTQLVPIHKQYNDIVRRIAAEQNVLLLDLDKEFSALPYETLRDKYMMFDGIHWRPAGSRAIAESLYRFMQERQLL